MANISKIILPSTDEYDIKDTVARNGLNGKQDTLVSGTNIKTINNTSLLGSGNIDIDNTVDQTYDPTSANAQSGVAVASAIAELPEPMIFKGSLGTGGTITVLPTASSDNEGFVYKVITAGTYASQAADVGDVFISDGSAWVLIPSGDEPSGTVTSVATGSGLTGGPITSSGTISLDTAYGDTVNPYGSKTANQVLAAPNGSNGTPSFRALVASDLPNGNWVNGSATGSVRMNNSASEDSTYTIGQYAVAEGNSTKASGISSHSEGAGAQASGDESHAEGMATIASGDRSHAEGMATIAIGDDSHAEGLNSSAKGGSSHAEGYNARANGYGSHAEGYNAQADGNYSHVEGSYTYASGNNSHTQGRYNLVDSTAYTKTTDTSINPNKTYYILYNGRFVEPFSPTEDELPNYYEYIPENAELAFIIGNGTSNSNRSNALTVDWSGNQVLAGKLTVGAAPAADMDVATKKYVDDNAGSVSVYYKKNESTYTTITSSETTIPVGITGFRSTDILMVDVEGLNLVEDVDYTISGTNIVLTSPITHTGTTVHFTAMRIVEVTPQDYEALKGDSAYTAGESINISSNGEISVFISDATKQLYRDLGCDI